MTITEFLTARWDEREAAAKAALPGPWRLALNDLDGKYVASADGQQVLAVYAALGVVPVALGNALHIAANDPVWVLADIAAKRKILAAWQEAETCLDRGYSEMGRGSQLALRSAVLALAEPFSAHPDFEAATG